MPLTRLAPLAVRLAAFGIAAACGVPAAAAGTPPTTAPPAATPEIIAARITPDPIHPGCRVQADVDVAPDVTRVDAHVKALTFHLTGVQSGHFRLARTVPKIARFFKGTYRVTFVALSSSGRTAQVTQNVVLE